MKFAEADFFEADFNEILVPADDAIYKKLGWPKSTPSAYSINLFCESGLYLAERLKTLSVSGIMVLCIIPN